MGTAKIQGELWGARAADWSEFNEPAWHPLFEAIVARAGITKGMRHLDIGCGSGGALALSRSRGAVPFGLDASLNLVEIARRRVPDATIEVGEMEDLPFADGCFDVVTAINSVQFAGDPVRALSEARRVMEPEGTLLVVVWGRREDCDLVRTTMPAVFALLPAPPPGTPPPRPWADPRVIEELMAQAGLSPTGDGEIAVDLRFSSQARAIRAVLSASARAIAHVGEAAVAEAVAVTLPAFTRADGSVVWKNRFRWVSAQPKMPAALRSDAPGHATVRSQGGL